MTMAGVLIERSSMVLVPGVGVADGATVWVLDAEGGVDTDDVG